MSLFQLQTSALRAALQRFWRTPFSSLFTLVAIGVAISLPAGLYLGLSNLALLAGNLPAQPEISLFLKVNVTSDEAQSLQRTLTGRKDIRHAQFISKEVALKELSKAASLTDITAGLEANPLPDAWVLTPADSDPGSLEKLSDDLAKLPGVDQVKLDSQWAARLQAGLKIGRTLVLLLTILFGLALMAITGNAIRAQILAKRDEIQVSRLIGATDRYVRRPFLYHGTLQGLLGGLMALLILLLLLLALQGPVSKLASLYASPYQLSFLDPAEMGVILLLAAIAGWLGAWVAVSRALRQVDPG